MELAHHDEPRLRDLLFGSAPSFSFELFPPRQAQAAADFPALIDELAELSPSFVSITCGANGSAPGATFEVALQLRQRGLRAVPHLTCRGRAPAQLEQLLLRLAGVGVQDVLALRGDPPKGSSEEPEGELKHASDLVRLIRRTGLPLGVGAACYPEGHVDAVDPELDLLYLKAKVAAGADFLITQAFFDNAFYFHFVDRCHRAGIHVPIVPGMLPITGLERLEKMSHLCGATIPRRLQRALERNPAEAERVGIEWTIAQCEELLARGVPGLHFFTMNRVAPVRAILPVLRGRRAELTR